MPTGYTCDVQDGKVTTFRDYALNCARAFGACIMLRDDPPGPAPCEMPPRSTYYDEALARAETTLAGLERMTAEDVEAGCIRDYADRLSRWRQRRLERERGKQNYMAMLAQVEAWTPPTTDHAEFKNFMAQQLHTSIDHDCSDRYDTEPETMTPAQWHADALIEARRQVAYYTDELAKDIERHNGRNKWLADLHNSLI